jgi:hypothetical protein
MNMKQPILVSAGTLLLPADVHGQSTDWQAVIWREPQVRYLLADMTPNGGKTGLHRGYATEERDPDSREAIRLWDAGARVVNTNDFERKKANGRPLRTGKGSNERISGMTVTVSTDP